MQFTDRLPQGAAGDWRFPVLAPDGGLTGQIDGFRNGKITFLDLAVDRDYTRLLVRIVLRSDELIEESPTVFRIENARAILLDMNGQPNGDVVTVTGFLSTEAVSKGTPAGMLTMWRQSFEIDSQAS